MLNSKYEIRNTKIMFLSGLLLLLLCGSAFGYSMTLAGSGELNVPAAAFQDTEFIDNAVALKMTGEAAWAPTDRGVTVKEGAYDADMVATDGDGADGAFLAWREYSATNSYFVFAGRVDASGSKLWEVDGVANGFKIANNKQIYVAKSVNGSSVDGVLLAWITAESISKIATIAYAKIGTDGTLRWEKLVRDAAPSGDLQIVSDGSGGMVITWIDVRGYKEGAAFAQDYDGDGDPRWVTGGVTVCAASEKRYKTQARIISVGADGYVVSWRDQNTDDDTVVIRARKISAAGVPDSLWSRDGVVISSHTGKKSTHSMVRMQSPYTGVVFVWIETPSPSGEVIYVQRIDLDASRPWTSDLYLAGTDKGGRAVPLSAVGGETYVAWLTGTVAGTAESYVQRISPDGALLLGPTGISLGKNPAYFNGVVNETNRLYVSGAIFTREVAAINYYPRAQKVSSSGELLWGTEGVPLSPYNMVISSLGTPLPIISSAPRGVIVAWADSRLLKKGIYAQRAADLYYPTGGYVTKKCQNTEPRFYSWNTATWEALGAVSVEVRTAPGSPEIDSASWTVVPYNGSIPNNGRWIQSRVTFAPGSGRATTASLSALTFGYSIDSSSPSIASVEVDGHRLIDGDPVGEAPVITVTATDDVGVTSIEVDVDDTPVSPAAVYAAAVRTQQTATFHPTITEGSHTMTVRALDEAGNVSTVYFTIYRTRVLEVQGRVRATVASPSKGENAIIAYTLTAQASVTLEIRDITGTLVKRVVYQAGTNGAAVGENEVTWDGKSQAGEIVGNGVYPFVIVAEGKKLASGKVRVQ